MNRLYIVSISYKIETLDKHNKGRGMHMKDEQQLIKAAQNGDLKAFETLIHLYEKTIYNICMRLLQNPEEAYDAGQEVCIKIWKQLNTFEGQAKLSTWIYRMATNQCLDILRKNKKRVHDISIYQQGTSEEEEWLIEGIPEEDIAHIIERKEMHGVLVQGLGEIKPDYKVIIVLRDIELHSYEEIAAILNLSLGTVKSRLSRARLALKKVLQQDKEPYRSFFRQKK